MILIGIGIIFLAVAVFVAGTDIATALQKIATEIRIHNE